MVGRRPSQQSVASDDGSPPPPAKMTASFKYLSKSSSSGSSHKEHRPSQLSNSSTSSNSSTGTTSTTTPSSIHVQPINTTAHNSVISSIPYESISTKSKSPIPVAYLPSNNDSRRSVAAPSIGGESFAPSTLISGPIPPLPLNRKHSQGSTTSSLVGGSGTNGPGSSSVLNGSGSGSSGYQLTPVMSNASSFSQVSSHHQHSMNPPKQRVGSGKSTHSHHRHSKSGEQHMYGLPTASRSSSYSIEDDTISIRSTKTSKSSIFGMGNGEIKLEKPSSDAAIERMFLELMVSSEVEQAPEPLC